MNLLRGEGSAEQVGRRVFCPFGDIAGLVENNEIWRGGVANGLVADQSILGVFQKEKSISIRQEPNSFGSVG